MSDFRFDDIVDTNRMIGPEGKHAVSICKTCSERHKVVQSDFVHPTHKRLEEGDDGYEFVEFVPDEIDQDFLVYVSSMRAWNCCHECEIPLDGMPEQPDTPYGFEFGDN